MNYKIFGPYEIPRMYGESKRRINKEDIDIFWSRVGSKLADACGCYVFAIKTRVREKPWYVGKANKQSFSKECFTSHKLVHYHAALDKSNGIPMMYFLARYSDKGRISKPSTSAKGHSEMSLVEQMFIEMGYYKNNDIRNKRGIKNPERLVIEGVYNHKDRRKKSVKQMCALFGVSEKES